MDIRPKVRFSIILKSVIYYDLNAAECKMLRKEAIVHDSYPNLCHPSGLYSGSDIWGSGADLSPGQRDRKGDRDPGENHTKKAVQNAKSRVSGRHASGISDRYIIPDDSDADFNYRLQFMEARGISSGKLLVLSTAGDAVAKDGEHEGV